MFYTLKSFLMQRGWSRSSLSWAFYDWANSAFATVVLAGIFPIFYREYWASGLADEQVSFSVALINSLSGLLLMMFAPLLGAIADTSHIKKPLLVISAFAGAVLTIGFAVIPSGAWLIAAVCYVFAVFFFMAGNIFYDALLIDVTRPSDYDRVSAAGYGLGYLGGGLLLVLNVGLIWNAALFGAKQHQMMQVSFLITGLWWLFFTVPLLRYVREQQAYRSNNIRNGLKRFKQTIRLLRVHPKAGWFLLAYWLYIDGVDTVIRMATVYGQSIGFSAVDLLSALLLVQFVGFPATLVYGWLAHRFGSARLIVVGICGYIVICLWGALIETLTGFYLLATLIALLQGGLQAQSRAFFANLIPQNRSAHFFGLYNLLGKFAVVIGPLLMGLVGMQSGSLRLGIASISILLLAGLWVLYKRVLR